MADCDAAIALRPNEAWLVFERGQARYELNQFRVRHSIRALLFRWQCTFSCAGVDHAACIHVKSCMS